MRCDVCGAHGRSHARRQPALPSAHPPPCPPPALLPPSAPRFAFGFVYVQLEIHDTVREPSEPRMRKAVRIAVTAALGLCECPSESSRFEWAVVWVAAGGSNWRADEAHQCHAFLAPSPKRVLTLCSRPVPCPPPPLPTIDTLVAVVGYMVRPFGGALGHSLGSCTDRGAHSLERRRLAQTLTARRPLFGSLARASAHRPPVCRPLATRCPACCCRASAVPAGCSSSQTQSCWST